MSKLRSDVYRVTLPSELDGCFAKAADHTWSMPTRPRQLQTTPTREKGEPSPVSRGASVSRFITADVAGVVHDSETG